MRAGARSALGHVHAGLAPKIVWDASKAAGEARKVADTTRATAILGFAPHIGLDEGIRRTIAWYRAHRV